MTPAADIQSSSYEGDKTQEKEQNLSHNQAIRTGHYQCTPGHFLLQINSVKDTKAKDIIHGNINRIKAMSLLHEKLFVSDDLEQIKLKDYIDSLIIELTQSFHLKKISFTVDCEAVLLPNNNLIPFGLILNELITNSLKYAFTDEIQALIDIQITTSDEGLVFLYKDNGIGVNQQSMEEGFGFKLLQSLIVYQLKGTIKYFNNQGLNYNISFPHSIFEK